MNSREPASGTVAMPSDSAQDRTSIRARFFRVQESASAIVSDGWPLAAWRVLRVMLLGAGFLSLNFFNGTPALSASVFALSLAAILAIDRSEPFKLWASYILGIVVFTHARALADSTFISTKYHYVIEIDEFLFFGNLPTIWLQERFYEFGTVSQLDSLMVGVHLSYFIIPHALAIAFAVWSRRHFALYVSGILATYYIGLLIYFAIPTSPPWLASHEGYLPDVVRIMEVISLNISAETYEQGYRIAGSNDVAAMPSLHFAITAVIMLAHWKFGWVLRIFGMTYAGLMGLALVYLGEHYVIDTLVGLVVALCGWRLASLVIDRYLPKGAPAAPPNTTNNGSVT